MAGSATTPPGARAISSSSAASTGLTPSTTSTDGLRRRLSGPRPRRCLPRRTGRHPVDPRHRLVTTKYNPARTWTPQNAVGIGGAYLCIYGMEGPGGYQFVGRTIQVWNTPRAGTSRSSRAPWLLRFFDTIRWYPVGADELLDMRADMAAGRLDVAIEPGTFSIVQDQQFLAENAPSIEAFRAAGRRVRRRARRLGRRGRVRPRGRARRTRPGGGHGGPGRLRGRRGAVRRDGVPRGRPPRRRRRARSAAARAGGHEDGGTGDRDGRRNGRRHRRDPGDQVGPGQALVIVDRSR